MSTLLLNQIAARFFRARQGTSEILPQIGWLKIRLWGRRPRDGLYRLRDWDVGADLSEAAAKVGKNGHTAFVAAAPSHVVLEASFKIETKF